MRNNKDCNTFEEVLRYYRDISILMLMDNYFLKDVKDYKEYVIATFYKNSKIYHSIYIYKDSRGKNLYLKVLSTIDNPHIITSEDCNLEGFFKNYNNKPETTNKIKYSICLGFTDCIEYKYIDRIYSDDIAERSGVPFMNHIDEGLAILHLIGATMEAKKAYCLHPIYQSDDLLLEYGTKDLRDINIFGINSNVIVNTMEYRHIANDYLSKKEINSITDIKLSVIKDVNDMLIADKIQNRKDFNLYHKDTHPRSKQLTKYFNNWLEILRIPEDEILFLESIIS